MIDARRHHMLIGRRGSEVPAHAVGVRWKHTRKGHTDVRPRPSWACIRFAACGGVAGSDGVCRECAARYRTGGG